MKRILIFTLTALLLLMTACAETQTQAPPQETEPPAQPPEPVAEPTSGYTPGIYEIEVTGHNGKMNVRVEFDENSIKDIVMGENQESGYIGERAFEAIRDGVLSRQSLNVDTIAGATVTCAAVRSAVSKAVTEAGGDPSKLNEPAPADTTAYADETTQVVIVGSGAAGLATAIQAEELGLKVILIEKLGLLGGSSVRAGYMVGGDSSVQKAQGIDFSAEDWTNMMQRRDVMDHGLWQPESALAMSSAAGDNITWLDEMGVEFGEVNLKWQHYGPGGARVGPYAVTAMHNRMDERGIDYRLNTEATEIIMDGDKAVGVKVTSSNGQEYNIMADAVVLATGGYFANKAMVEQYDPEHADLLTDVCIGADGSGMLMAEAIGAELKYMHESSYHGMATVWGGCSRSLTLPAGNGGIAVNKTGQRYVNEAGAYEALAAGTLAQDEAFCIMDQTLMDLDVIKADKGLACIVEMYEIADTLDELAAKLGIDPEGLKATVEKYGEYVRNGKDEDFDKDPQFMRSDFTTPPYYGVKNVVENHTNHGGIVVTIENKAMTAAGDVIPGLYAVGECAASHIQGYYTYQACIHNGRVSARVIAAELLG